MSGGRLIVNDTSVDPSVTVMERITAYTNYLCSVNSSTSAGPGPEASVVGTTGKERECVCMCVSA